MPATATDQMVGQYQSELEERQAFINQVIEGASGRDLNPQEMELITRATDRMTVVNGLVGPLRESARIGQQARQTMAEIASEAAIARTPTAVNRQLEYRSAGEYIIDRWRAGVGIEDARERLTLYMRAAAHQTTADNPGIIPEPIVGNVLNFLDSSRPMVSTLGVNPVPGGRFTRPRVTQHTDVGPQAAEKTELVSRKMIIGNVPVTMLTYGGYVNVSRQNIDWSVPSIMDLVVNDLAAQYAIETEGVTGATLIAAATLSTALIDPTSTPAEVNAALWTNAAAAFTAMQGAGRLVAFVSPDMLGVIGPLFAPVNPQNAISTGFSAGSFGSGPMGSISGIPVVMSAALPAHTALLVNTAAAEVYEQRIGTLQVTEPSVLGVQVAYAGYFAPVVLEAKGVIAFGDDGVP